MNETEFVDALNEIGIVLNDKQIEQFKVYYETLVKWNEKMNLTAITEKNEVYEKHFYDCLLASQMIEFSNQKICDVGAGAGFPSVPLKIVYPDLEIVIVDSLEKRIKFLNELASQLGLDKFKAIAARAEEHAQENKEEYDIVMGRAVARLNILDELCIPLVKKGGYFLTLKGRQGEIEHQEASKGINILGAKLEKMEKYNLPSDESVIYLILYKKIK
ncbi:MAG: 16S rRNA (guanine(527)-N(7))-methyltransferase RsmG [Erysipelotrichales bacterium]